MNISLDSNTEIASTERHTRFYHRIVRGIALIVLMLTVTLLAGCSSLPGTNSAREVADTIAARANMVAAHESAGAFDLLTYRRGVIQSKNLGNLPAQHLPSDLSSSPVHVYIEGDGRAWRARRPPRNPTPHNPTGLRLAARDQSPAVLWIGRPCMYLTPPAGNQCDPKWWTSHRYASVVVDAMNALISRLIGTRRITLIGHSGGGVLATLLASQRSNVDALITVSSPLDLSYWAEQGRMTPLSGSLDPVDIAHLLSNLPQRHFAGESDKVVPVEVIRRFIRALPQPNQASLEIQPGGTHQCCWEQDWPQLSEL